MEANAPDKPRINIWLCYGGGLVAGFVGWLIARDWIVAMGAVVAWFVFYTFSLANRHGRATEIRNAAQQATEAALSRQARRAMDRRTAKDTRRS